jgi:hypothetical protein
MKIFRLCLCVLLGALVVAGAAQADGKDDDDRDCRRINAVGVGQATGPLTTIATITKGGILNGTTAASFMITGAVSPTVLTFTGTVTLTTKRGTLTVGIAGTLDVTTGAFDATGPVTGGTGRFAGATGTLRFQGVQDLVTGSFTETVRGTICLADDDDDDDD